MAIQCPKCETEVKDTLMAHEALWGSPPALYLMHPVCCPGTYGDCDSQEDHAEP